MQGAPSLAAMREAHAALAAQGHVTRALGLLYCQDCGCRRAFVTRDAHCSHITDAECDTCSFSYGRIDIPEQRRGVAQPDGSVREVVTPSRKKVPVISDKVAAEAAAALRASHAGFARRDEAPRPMPVMPPDDAGSDDSRVSSYLRGQR